MSTTGPRLFGDGRYISLATFRKSGERVANPVWFVEQDGKIYVRTEAATGKAKRIRNNPKVEMALCTARGKVTAPVVRGLARILPDQEAPRPAELIRKRYGWQLHIVDLIVRLTRKQPIYIEITPQ